MSTYPGRYPSTLEIERVTGPVDADITLPGSKSITNRALIIAALADGESTLQEALFSDDTYYMVQSLQQLGIPVQADEARRQFIVQGRAGAVPTPRATLFVGNSGTSARFLTALTALGSGEYTIDGVERMRQRPIAPLLEALTAVGAEATSADGNGCPPVEIRSSGISGGQVTMPGDTSSQYFTALLMIAPVTADGIRISVEHELVSKPYIDLTIRTMGDFGASVDNNGYREFSVPGGQPYSAREYAIEPDASAASYFFALAAATGGRVCVRNLGSGSVQGDIAFVGILEDMGCTVETTPDWIELTGPESLSGIDVDMNAISDTMPTLAAIAPLAGSPVTIRNVEHVRHKETDRIHAVVTELERLGINVEERQDGLTIHPGTPSQATICTYDDHRMAMSFAVLGTASGGITIDDPGCVAKTFPDFFDCLRSATGV